MMTMAQNQHGQMVSPPSKKRGRSEEHFTEHAAHVSNLVWDNDVLALANVLSTNLQQFGNLIMPGDPIVKCRRHTQLGVAYVKFRSKEELQKLLQWNGVVLLNGIQLKLAPWNLQPE